MDTQKLIEERGNKYGDPLEHFSTITAIENIWQVRRLASKSNALGKKHEAALAHGVHMIIDKLVRAAETPDHLDNWDDIAGYAQCIKGFLS